MLHTFQLSDYPILLAPLEETLPAWLQQHDYSQIFIVTDDNIREHSLPLLWQKTGLSPKIPLVIVPTGELHKTLATCEYIWQAMFAARLDRKALVVNLGGGVIGDMGGFCAATFKRGVDFIQIPTTLLAMTDAAIGGKLGIDFQGIKNAVGVFRNPAAVFVDPAFLHTLPARELRSGFAEVVKHALIGAPGLWETIRAMQANQLTPDSTDWHDLLCASIAVKVRVVTEDPLEKGLRALLNYGHTIGHAIESYFLHTEHPLTHGEAVAIGMICEGPLTPPPTPPLKGRGDVEGGVEYNLTHSTEDVAVYSTSPLPFRGGVGGGVGGDGVSSVILRHFGHRPIPESSFPALWELMLQDKKNTSGAVRIAVPDAEPFSISIPELTRAEMERRLRYYNALELL